MGYINLAARLSELRLNFASVHDRHLAGSALCRLHINDLSAHVSDPEWFAALPCSWEVQANAATTLPDALRVAAAREPTANHAVLGLYEGQLMAFLSLEQRTFDDLWDFVRAHIGDSRLTFDLGLSARDFYIGGEDRSLRQFLTASEKLVTSGTVGVEPLGWKPFIPHDA